MDTDKVDQRSADKAGKQAAARERASHERLSLQKLAFGQRVRDIADIGRDIEGVAHELQKLGGIDEIHARRKGDTEVFHRPHHGCKGEQPPVSDLIRNTAVDRHRGQLHHRGDEQRHTEIGARSAEILHDQEHICLREGVGGYKAEHTEEKEEELGVFPHCQPLLRWRQLLRAHLRHVRGVEYIKEYGEQDTRDEIQRR